jgi:hypothetical protein
VDRRRRLLGGGIAGQHRLLRGLRRRREARPRQPGHDLAVPSGSGRRRRRPRRTDELPARERRSRRRRRLVGVRVLSPGVRRARRLGGVPHQGRSRGVHGSCRHRVVRRQKHERPHRAGKRASRPGDRQRPVRAGPERPRRRPRACLRGPDCRGGGRPRRRQAHGLRRPRRHPQGRMRVATCSAEAMDPTPCWAVRGRTRRTARQGRDRCVAEVRDSCQLPWARFRGSSLALVAPQPPNRLPSCRSPEASSANGRTAPKGGCRLASTTPVPAGPSSPRRPPRASTPPPGR